MCGDKEKVDLEQLRELRAQLEQLHREKLELEVRVNQMAEDKKKAEAHTWKNVPRRPSRSTWRQFLVSAETRQDQLFVKIDQSPGQEVPLCVSVMMTMENARGQGLQRRVEL